MVEITNAHSINFSYDNFQCGSIISSFTTDKFYISDEDAQIMRWVSPLEPNNRHQEVRTGRFGSLEGAGLLEQHCRNRFSTSPLSFLPPSTSDARLISKSSLLS